MLDTMKKCPSLLLAMQKSVCQYIAAYSGILPIFNFVKNK